jgi:hypothetical protein
VDATANPPAQHGAATSQQEDAQAGGKHKGRKARRLKSQARARAHQHTREGEGEQHQQQQQIQQHGEHQLLPQGASDAGAALDEGATAREAGQP